MIMKKNNFEFMKFKTNKILNLIRLQGGTINAE